MTEYEYHRYADVFPLMTDQERRELVDDIRAHGQREPITLYQKQILDGRNRHKACRELGIKPLYVDFEGDDAAALDFVISMNCVRRHLTTSQRAMIADDLATLRQGQRKSDASNEASQIEAAKQMHVSRPTVQRARKVKQKGTPELAAAVRQGEISVSAAAAQIDAQRLDQTLLIGRATPAANGHADPRDADLDVTDLDEDDDEEEIIDVVGDLGDPDAADGVPLSFAFERPDGSLVRFAHKPETIGDALEIVMHIETVDEWLTAFPGDGMRRLADLGEHVKMLVATISGGSGAPAKSKPKAKAKAKTKAKPKSRRKR